MNDLLRKYNMSDAKGEETPTFDSGIHLQITEEDFQNSRRPNRD